MSEPSDYKNFDLQIERAGRGFWVSVLGSPAGQGLRSKFRPPYSDADLQAILARLANPNRDLRLSEAHHESAQQIGKRLFEALFTGEVRSAWRESRGRVETAGQGLRLSLCFKDAPHFESWPWELMFDPDSRQFIAQSSPTTVVRFTRSVAPLSPPAEPPLRMLVVVAKPAGYPQLDGEREWHRLSHALEGWAARGWIDLKRLHRATLEELQKSLQEPCHILHIVSHSQFVSERREGALILEDNDGRPQEVTGVRLGTILSRQRQLRLVVLNSCEGAITSVADPFAGLAQALVGSQIPAVVAMRSRIKDDTAIKFAENFYESLSRNLPVDAALTDARSAMYSRQDDLEWTIPVLYTRSPDCHLFRFPQMSTDLKPALKPNPLISPDEPQKPTLGLLRRIPWPVWAAVVAIPVIGALYPFTKSPPADPNVAYAAMNPPECPSPPDIPMAFVKVPVGSFFTADKARREVTITRPFCIGRFEVTQAQWKKIMGGNPSAHKGDALPVEKVLQGEIQDFLKRLNERAPGAIYRRPTNAQWEYAARAGTEGPYSFNGNPEEFSRYGNCQDRSSENNRGSTIQVGSLKPNPWGIFDMYGNVAEWVEDDPGVPSGKHIRRGGGFRTVPANCDSVNQSAVLDHRNNDTGFRIVRDLKK